MTYDSEAIVSRLIRMEAKLDGYLFRTERLENRQDANELRIRALENGTSRILAGASVVAFLAATFGTGLIELIR
jgi:hypothetical protein